MLSIFLGVCLVISLLYISRLHNKIKSYEHVWQQIESVADRNQDGSFQIDVRHLEHVQADRFTEEDSGTHLILDGILSNGNASPSRAA